MALHNSIIFALLLLGVHNFLKVFSHRDKLLHTSFHYRNYFLLSFSLPKSFLPLRRYLSLILRLSAPAEEVVNSFIFHVKFTAFSQMLAKKTLFISGTCLVIFMTPYFCDLILPRVLLSEH